MIQHSDIAGVFSLIEKDILAAASDGLADPNHLASPSAYALSKHADSVANVDPARLLVWAMSAELPAQPWANPFGDPAITVVCNDQFRIDILYWNQNATPTHKHVSCGAFLALHGTRLHQIFEFTDRREISPTLAVGKFRLAGRYLMRQGDVHEIRPDLIHDVFWHARPSVTLSIRCAEHPTGPGHPWEYCDPGISFLSMHLQEKADTRRRVAAMATLRKASPRIFEDALSEVILSGEPSLVYHVIFETMTDRRASEWQPLVERALAQRSDAFSAVMIDAIPHIRRKIRLYPVYTGNTASQMVVSLLWAGASAAETCAFIAEHVGSDHADRVLARAARDASAVSADIPELEPWQGEPYA